MSFIARRYHDLSCGHRVFGHESKCAYLHGHNYRIHFLCKPNKDLDNLGRVLDFSAINELLCQWLETHWDHRFLIWERDPWYMQLYAIDTRIKPVPFNPTAENMARYLVEVIGPTQLKDSGVKLIEVTVEETRKCWATYKSPWEEL